MFDAITKPLIDQGVLGVMLLVVLFAYWKLQQRLDAVQEQRVKDALKVTEAIHTFASAIERNTEAMNSFVVEE